MKKYLSLSALLLISCSDFSTDLKGDSVLNFGNSTGTILTCTDKLDGKVVKPADGSEYRLCKDGQWFAVEIGDFDESDVIKPTAKSSSSQKSEVSKQSSSSKMVIVFDEDDDDELFPSKQSSSSDKTAPSSSSATNVPASSAIVTPPASSSEAVKPVASSSSVAVAASSSSKIVIFEPDDPIVSPIVSSSSVAPKSSSSTIAKSSSSGVVAKSSSSTTVAAPSSSSITKPVSSSSEKIIEPEPESSSEDTVESSSSKDPVENLYICEDGETIVENIDNCPENQEPESSSSEKEVVEPEPESSSAVTIATKYDCNTYNCVTTEYLNQEMLAAGEYGELLDERDNQVYRTIKIGEQIWMAQNLNYVTVDGNADNEVASWCYDSEPSYCEVYGRLYTWAAAMDLPSTYNSTNSALIVNEKHTGICPEGWRIPNSEDWTKLGDYVYDNNGEKDVAASLKVSTSLWVDDSTNNTDQFGFSALPAGEHYSSKRFYESLGQWLVLWYNSDNGYSTAHGWNVGHEKTSETNTKYGHYYDNGRYNKSDAHSVRCIYNEATTETEQESSSSEETVEPEPESSSGVSPATKYDCSKYNCVTTEYLNQEMLAEGKYGELLDERDNQIYRTIKIGEQTWMAQNLNYETENSRCYSGSTANCIEFGRLYYQSEAKNVCPTGWHLPTNSEWETLNSYVDLNNGTEGVGNSLKSLTWTYGQAGTDLFGFSGLASHFFGSVIFCGSSTHGLYWTADNNEYRCLLSDNSSLYYYKDTSSPTWGMSVRCLQDENTQTSSTESSSSSEKGISSSSEITAPKEFGVTTLLINTDIQPPVLGIYVDNYAEKDIANRGIVVGTSEEDLIANSKIETQESGYFDIFMSSTPQTGATTHYFQNTTCKYEECAGVLRMLYGNTTYYVRSFVQLKDDSIIYGDVKSFETLDFTRSSSRIDYANVYSFSTSRFDCVTDEQIPAGYTYISYTNERPAAVLGSQSYAHYKVLTTWNHGIWNAGHSGKAVMTPTLHVENGELTIEAGDCSKANSATCDAGNEIYYSVNGDLFRGETFTELYEAPVKVKTGDLIQAYSQSSLGYHSALNFYVVTE